MPLLNVSEQKKPMVAGICLALIALSLLWIATRSCSCAPSVGTKPSDALGTVVAEETAKLLQERGKVVVLAMKGRQVAEVEAFEKRLKKFSGVSIAATEYFEVTSELPNVPGDVFVSLLKRYPQADAIVSFGGTPAFTADHVSALPEKLPKIIAVSWSISGVRKLLETHILQMAVLPRLTAPPTKKPKTMRDWFDKYFQIFTAANAATLSE